MKVCINLEVLSNFTTPKIKLNTSKGLQNDFEEGEALNVLKHIKNNKAPNSDGYAAEFSLFLSDIKFYVDRAFSYIFPLKKASYLSKAWNNFMFAKS